MSEIWRDVAGYEGFYMVSNLGRVKKLGGVFPHKRFGSYTRKEQLKTHSKDRGGYSVVGLSKKGKSINKLSHRLVALAFMPNPENKPDVSHIDGNKGNNFVSNLEWTTHSENMIHASSTGSYDNVKKLTDAVVCEIKIRLLAGEKGCDLALKYNVSGPTISYINTGKKRANVRIADFV